MNQEIIVFDLETDGLLDSLTKIHVLGWWSSNSPKTVNHTTDYKVMIEVFSKDAIFVGHNIELFDSIVIEKVLNVVLPDNTIDTLALSHYLRNNRIMHGLASYQEEVGIAKVLVEDWVEGSIELYISRVTEDVKINVNLLYLFFKELKALYGDNYLKIAKFMSSYFNDYREHYYSPFAVDLGKLKEYHSELEGMVAERADKLKASMPPVMKIVCIPNKLYLKNGKLSEAGKKWYTLLEENNCSLDVLEIEVVDSEPNPMSQTQLKDWLLSLGWVATYFKEGANGPVPQIKTKEGDLCPNIVKLNLDGTNVLSDLFIVNHRLGNIKRIGANLIDNKFVAADIGGLTNTLRIKHRTLVNLTKIKALHGKYERGVLTCEANEILIGSDLSSLENFTRTNLICDIDPGAIDELLDPDFDTHLDIARIAGLLNTEDINRYKNLKSNFDNLSKEELKDYLKIDSVRDKAKTTSYSSLYGVGYKKLAKEIGCSEREAKILLEAYWKKNFAVKVFENSLVIESINGSEWVKSPANGLYYPVRSKKDLFSLINQSFGAYIFKLWIKEIRSMGVKITGQFHDEVIVRCLLQDKDFVTSVIKESLESVNNKLRLRIPIKCDVKYGKYYSEIH